MKKAKKIGITAAVIIGLIGLGVLYWFLSGWPICYRSRLNDFFGKGNWTVVSEVNKSKREYMSRSRFSDGSFGAKIRMGIFYREWYILYENEDGEEVVWQISNQAYQYNHAQYGIFNSRRYRGRQALTLELMEISFAVIEEDIHNDIVKRYLSDEEAENVYVLMTYEGGNPPKSFYDDLADEPWFNIEGVTAENYLATDLYDFYLRIGVYDYDAENLSEEEKDNIMDGLEEIEERLLEEYGGDASFEIYFDGYKVEYVDGERQ